MENVDKLSELENKIRENFDLESILGYYASGKLVTWLSDRYYDIESERMKLLDASSEDLMIMLD